MCGVHRTGAGRVIKWRVLHGGVKSVGEVDPGLENGCAHSFKLG